MNKYNPKKLAHALHPTGKRSSGNKKYNARKTAINENYARQYLHALRESKDENIVGYGSTHLILNLPTQTPQGFYYRISFEVMNDSLAFYKKLKFIKEKRIPWSERLSEKKIIPECKGAAFQVIPPGEVDKITAQYKKDAENTRLLYRFWNKHCLQRLNRTLSEEYVILYGETIQAAAENVENYLYNLNLSDLSVENRTKFSNNLLKIYSKMEEYVDFIKQHLYKYRWASFAFDLQSLNALVFYHTPLKGEAEANVLLTDLDAEEKNCFELSKYYLGEDRHHEFCSLFGGGDKTVLAMAAFLLFVVNSIKKYSKNQWGLHAHLEDASDSEPHKHTDCAEYIIALTVHKLLQVLKNKDPETYAGKIRKLFNIMINDGFWKESTRHMTGYLGLPTKSAGYDQAWAFSTGQMSEEIKHNSEELNRRRWLVLLFLNVLKCSKCKNPPKWLLEDLVEPLWEDLQIEEGWFKQHTKLDLHLSLDFLRGSTYVKMSMDKPAPKKSSFFFS